METAYNNLLDERSLYPTDFVQSFGVAGKHWKNESDKKRELSLRHDMVCVLLCNMQPQDHYNIIREMGKRKYEGQHKKELRRRLNIEEGGADEVDFVRLLGKPISTPSTSKQSSSSGSSRDTDENTRDEESLYRYWLIEGMTNPEQIQSILAKEFKCEKPNSQWDIADRKLKKFVEVKVTLDFDCAISSYNIKKENIPDNTALVLVHPVSSQIKFVDHPGDFNGIPKVMQFILKRYTFMRNLGIMDTPIQEEGNLKESIFCSPFFNESLNKWVEDWWNLTKENVIPPEDLYKELSAPPNIVTPSALLEGLTSFDEKFRRGTVRYKGKILPELVCANIETSEETDFNMISVFFNEITKYGLLLTKRGRDCKANSINNDIVQIIAKAWSDEKSTNFNLCLDLLNMDERSDLKIALGIGEKRLIHNPDNEDVQQPQYKKLKPKLPSNWFPMLLYCMNSKSQYYPFLPYSELLEEPPNDSHPLAIICEEAASKTFHEILKTNSAITSAKLTNIHSRLGGAYLCRDLKKNRENSQIAIMPIYASTMDCTTPANRRTKRILSGVLIRGPNHAKSPTDRINFITIELFHNNPNAISFTDIVAKAMTNENKDDKETPFFLLVRQNSIMKEDPSYGTFNANALFVPLNLLGAMTLENTTLPSDYNPREALNKILQDHSDWFCESFTEGLLMAMIGNSRDEGYFALLRKLFMILHTMMNHDRCFNWNIKSFCDSINECLIDNPLSMHYHQTVLKILEIRRLRSADL
uniref:Polymerase PA n=1 Tax=Raphidiopteran orthomyxo-related virus OKIAV180 TaxID=2792563 RepID=A0A7T0M462_9ORTO|nr:polymerase PA [Raphidiopteran orthomyxo-related virus OKIAV180]